MQRGRTEPGRPRRDDEKSGWRRAAALLVATFAVLSTGRGDGGAGPRGDVCDVELRRTGASATRRYIPGKRSSPVDNPGHDRRRLRYW